MSATILSKFRIGAAAFLSILVLVACTTTVDETGRKQFNVLDPGDEAKMGLTEFERYKNSKTISSNSTYNGMVRRVGSRLSQVIKVPNAEWEFVVFSDSTPNAFALPGGKVGVHTGLFKIVQNEAQLAAVLGHEIGHVKARHSGERLTNAAAGAAVGAVLGEVLHKKTGASRSVTHGAAQGAVTLRTLSFSRRQELEADKLGAIYMAQAGYNPEEAVKLWERFAAYKASSGSAAPPVFLSTHPLDSQRIDALQKFMPKALGYYKG